MLWRKGKSDGKIDHSVRCTGCKKWGVSHRCYKCKSEYCSKCFGKHECPVQEKKLVFTTSMYGNRCDFCGKAFIESVHTPVCSQCKIIVEYDPKSVDDFFAAWNRVMELILMQAFNIERIDKYYYEDRYGKHVNDAIYRAIREYRKIH